LSDGKVTSVQICGDKDVKQYLLNTASVEALNTVFDNFTVTCDSLSSTTHNMPLSDNVCDFITHKLSDVEPVLLPYTDCGAGYISGACHLNVAHRVKRHGGERVFGWMIWTGPMFTEGEFHSVWRSPDGELMDITPRVDGEEFILFVPDPKTKVQARGVGAVLPSNRTTIPGAPYTMGGMPGPKFAYREPDARTRAHMAKLGMDHFIGGDQ
jgi:hypothetical protein